MNLSEAIIKEIKKESEKGKSVREIAKEYRLNRRTVSKYINVVEIEGSSVYNNSNRNYSYLDTYNEKISELYSQTKNISKIYIVH